MLEVRESTEASRAEWLKFGIENNVDKVVTPSGAVHEFCQEVHRKKSHRKAKPLCLHRLLISHVKFIMKLCRDHSIICELVFGTELGAVKAGGILPWDWDADIHVYANHTERLWVLKHVFEDNGYSLSLGKEYKGEYMKSWAHSHSHYWRVDIYSHAHLDSVDLIHQGKQPTRVLFDGEWQEVSRNPVLNAMDLYSPDLFRHVDYIAQPQVPGPQNQGSHPAECSDPGSHGCTGQYPVDGNLDFEDPCP